MKIVYGSSKDFRAWNVPHCYSRVSSYDHRDIKLSHCSAVVPCTLRRYILVKGDQAQPSYLFRSDKSFRIEYLISSMKIMWIVL